MTGAGGPSMRPVPESRAGSGAGSPPAGLARRPGHGPARQAEVAVVLGTRSEAVALAPVVRALRRSGLLSPLVVSTGQQRGVLDQVLRPLGVRPDVDLALAGRPDDGSSRRLDADAVERLGELLAARRPDAVLVHGGSATAFGAALAACSEGIDVGHLGAGLRTRPSAGTPGTSSGGLPPEEVNQRLIAPLARWHLAPSTAAAANLLAEGIDPGAITVTGTTGVDAVLWAASLHRGTSAFAGRAHAGHSRGRLLACLRLCDGDRDRLAGVADALRRLAADGLDVVLPLPPDGVSDGVRTHLTGDGVRLVPPLAYLDFVATMREATLVVTDSGTIEEEAPALGTPVLVVRDATDRAEGVRAGIARLVGTDPQALVRESRRLVGEYSLRAVPDPQNPFGDGGAAGRVLEVLTRSLAGAGEALRRRLHAGRLSPQPA